MSVYGRFVAAACVLGWACLGAPRSAEPPPKGEGRDYAPADKELQVVTLDSSDTDSFLAVRADSTGRLFVGGRKALYVYEVDADKGYKPRQKLLDFPDHTWVYDIAVRGHDLYLMTVSALYRVKDGVVKREGLAAERLIWGVPLGHVHQCLHALTWGPEGDLYFTMGDPLWYYGDFDRPDHWGHWTMFCQPHGTKVPYTGVGAVFRCRPDGTELKVVSRGLRNSCGLTCDHDYNLFTNDNDHEAMPAEYVPGRLIHAVPYADYSWPRGWMRNKSPARFDILETMTNDLGRAVPVGETYYDDEFLGETYRHNLFLARWCTRSVTRYPIRERGASFKTEEFPVLVGKNDARPVGVCVGRGGRVFATIAHMAHNDNSPTYRSELVMITRADDKPGFPFDALDVVKASDETLYKELAHKSWSRRQEAHQELLRRGKEALKSADKRLDECQDADTAAVHLVWLAAVAHRGEKAGPSGVRGKFNSKSSRLDAQAVRAWAEEFPFDGRKEFVDLLTTAYPPRALAALIGLHRNGDKDIPPALLDGPTQSADTYLRQSAVLFLAERAPLKLLQDLSRSRNERKRLAAVLAAGYRLTTPPDDLPDNLPLEPMRNPEEAYVITYADGKVDLRKQGRLGNFTLADHWKASKHSAEQEALFALLRDHLTDTDEDAEVQLQAAHFLFLLNDARTEPEITAVRRETDQIRLSTAPIATIGHAWVAGPFPDGKDGFKKVHPPEKGLIDLGASYPVGAGRLAWKEIKTARLFDLSKEFGPCAESSFYTFTRLESAAKTRALLLVGSNDGVKVWLNGKPVFTNDIERVALPCQDTVLLDLQAGSNDFLVRVRNRTEDCGLYLHIRAHGAVVARLPEKLNKDGLAERLKGSKDVKIDDSFLKVDWEKEVTKGDVLKGQKLFKDAGCVKCHAITNDATAGGGPSLAEARKRFTVPYLVESVLLPSKQVSPVFRATLIEMKNGKVVTGLVVKETAEEIELIQADTTKVSVAKAAIAERRLTELSPMPSGVIKTPEELRDLIAYVLNGEPADK